MCNASQVIKNEGKIEGKIEIYYNEMQLSVHEISERLGVEEGKVKEIITALPASSK